jgi:hypothetical protein
VTPRRSIHVILLDQIVLVLSIDRGYLHVCIHRCRPIHCVERTTSERPRAQVSVQSRTLLQPPRLHPRVRHGLGELVGDNGQHAIPVHVAVGRGGAELGTISSPLSQTLVGTPIQR